MTARTRFALFAVVLLAVTTAGCSSTSTCSRDEDTIDIYNGFVNADRTVYSSVQPAPPAADGGALSSAELRMLPPYTYFPANRIIRFHIGLVAAPTDIRPFLTFSPDRDATIAPGAGNQNLIRAYNKDEVVLRNDTCSEFWVWLTASTSATPFHQLGDGGAEGGASSAEPSDTAGASGAQ